MKRKPPKSVAYHEAGHAVGVLTTKKGRIRRLWIRASPKGGSCLHEGCNYREEAYVALMGPFAEAEYRKRYKIGPKDKRTPEALWGDIDNYDHDVGLARLRALQYCKYFAKPSEEKNEDRLFEARRTDARRAVETHWKGVESLALALWERLDLPPGEAKMAFEKAIGKK